MATQGVVTVVIGDETVVKAVTGSEGYNANLLVEEIHRGQLVTPEEVLAAAKRVGFGHKSDLVVQGRDKILFEGDEDLSGLYLDRSKFLDPRFNPRWEHGTADFVEVVEFPSSEVSESNPTERM